MRYRTRSVVIPLVLANIGIFILQVVLGQWFTESFLLASDSVLVRPWILITSMFLHANVTHILFNMYVLFIFGPLLEQRIGPKRFLYIYFLSGIIAGIVSSLFYPLVLGTPLRALGASGAIMGILGVIIMLMPNLKVLFFFIIPMPLWIAAIIFAAIDIFGIFYPSGIANVAHLTGLACGLLYGMYLKKQKRHFNRRFSSRSTMDADDIEDYLRSGKI